MPKIIDALPKGVHDGCYIGSLEQPCLTPNVGRSHLQSKPFTHSKNTSKKESNQAYSAQAESLLDNIGMFPVHFDQETDEKTASRASERAKSDREKLFEMRRIIGDFYKTVRPCGHYPRKQGEDVAVVKGKSGSTYYTNLQQCKSRWACPICSMKIAKQRADEVRDVLTNAVMVDGYKAVMITLTLPHCASDRLHYLDKQVRGAFSGIMEDSKYKGQKRDKEKAASGGLKQQYGVQGHIRALEVKKSLEHGWHPHLHVCFVLDAQADIEAFAKQIIKLWAAHVLKRSGKRVNQKKSQNWKEVTNISGIADYTSKWDIGRELAESNRKDDGSGLPVFKLVELFQEAGDMQYMKDFLTFANAMKNASPVEFSKNGFKKRFLRGIEDKTEAQACEEEDVEKLLFSIHYEIFKELRRQRLEAHLLDLAQFHPEQLMQFLKDKVPEVVNVADVGSPPNFKMA